MKVAHHAQVGDLEEGLVLVLVDHHDGLRGLHAGGVLDGAGNAEADVELRGDRDTRLADLVGGVVEALVHGVTGGTDGAPEGVSHRLHHVGELVAHAAAAGDDDLGRGQLRACGLLRRGEGGDGDVLRGGSRQLKGSGRCSHRLWVRGDGTRAQRVDHGTGGGGGGLVGAAEDGVVRGAVGVDAVDVDQSARAQAGGEAAGDFVVRRGGGQHDGCRVVGGQGVERVHLRGNDALVVVRGGGLHHLGRT